MTATAKDIPQLLRDILKLDKIPSSILGTVKSVDEDEMTCVVTPIDEGPDFMDVLLMAESSTTGFYLKPSVDSLVMIAPQNNETYYISLVSDIDEVWIRGNANGGVTKVSDMVTRLNNIENKVNDLVTYSSTHVHTGVQTGGGSSGPASAPVTGSLTLTTADDIQSTTVKHG